jgi:hypothetical protein
VTDRWRHEIRFDVILTDQKTFVLLMMITKLLVQIRGTVTLASFLSLEDGFVGHLIQMQRARLR